MFGVGMAIVNGDYDTGWVIHKISFFFTESTLFDEVREPRLSFVDCFARSFKSGRTATTLLALLPYGLAPNRQALEDIIQYALEQRIIARPVTVEELFPPSTHALLG